MSKAKNDPSVIAFPPQRKHGFHNRHRAVLGLPKSVLHFVVKFGVFKIRHIESKHFIDNFGINQKSDFVIEDLIEQPYAEAKDDKEVAYLKDVEQDDLIQP